MVRRSGLRRVRAIAEIGAVVVQPGGDRAAAREALRAVPAVRAIEPEIELGLRYLPDDPALVVADSAAPRNDFFEWHLRAQAFRGAWEVGRGAGARLAVLDSGVDGEHPDLGPRIVAALDRRPCGGLLQPDCAPRQDDNGHGSHVSGLACGTGENGFGVAGAAFRCDLIVERLTVTPGIPSGQIADAIVDATDRDADVINMSFGGAGSSQALHDAVNYAYNHDVVLVAAASNDDTANQGIPAEYLQPKGSGPEIGSGKGLVVTAAGYNGRRAWFGPGRGTGISLAAYGASSSSTRGIFSTFPANTTEIETGIGGNLPCADCRRTFQGDDRFAYLEGTSMATPQVAGAAALIRGRRPAMPNARVLRIIKRTASGDEFRHNLGWGILDAAAALRRATG